MTRSCAAILGAVLIALGATGAAQAIPTIFFGEDLNGSESTRLSSHPNADAARAAFLALLAGSLTEGFEGFPADPDPGAFAPLIVNFGSVTAILTDPGDYSFVNAPPNTYAGRYPSSGTKYWETVSDPSTSIASSIEFTQPQVAFGFYGIDIGDEGGKLRLVLDDDYLNPVDINNSTGTSTRGAVLYFGLIDTANPFTKVTFLNSSGTDGFGIDNFTIASQVVPETVPEPSTLVLLLSGLAVGGGCCGDGGRRAADDKR